MATKEEAVEAIKTIIDPDLFIDIWTLGLIYGIEFDETKAIITMTFTSVACPAGPMLMQQVRDRIGELEGVESVDVEVTFSPPWEPSDELKEMMGII